MDSAKIEIANRYIRRSVTLYGQVVLSCYQAVVGKDFSSNESQRRFASGQLFHRFSSEIAYFC